MDSISYTIAQYLVQDFINKMNDCNDDYYFNKIVVEKQELSNEFDSQTVDDICECVEDVLKKYLTDNNLNGYVDNGYNEIMIVQ